MKSFIPTPSHSAVALGPLTLHFYAICILLGTIVALLVGRLRYRKQGGDPTEIIDIALFAIPAGIVGGRLYHVLTSPDHYFGTGGRPLDALKIWDGGLGIWGAIALGTLVSFLVFRSKPRSFSFAHFADALAPGVLFAQGIGRFGNWFNGDLDVLLIGLEAGGSGIDSGKHAATLSGGTPGVLHGTRTYVLQDENGQTVESHSISAGLDYPGVGPEHAYLHDIGRAQYRAITDDQAMEAFSLLSRTEGIIPAIETAHALAGAMIVGKELGPEAVILINLSGRGDKDVQTAAQYFGIPL